MLRPVGPSVHSSAAGCVPVEQPLATKGPRESVLPSRLLFLCESFIAYVASSIYDPILHRGTVFKSMVTDICTYPVECAVR